MTDEPPDRDGDLGAATDVRDPVARPPDPVGAAALQRHARRMRPLRIGYAVAIVLALVAALVTVKIAYDHGEISHATLHTVAKAPASVPLGLPSASPGRAWSSTDATAIGTPFYRGTVVTWDQHTVRGRNARTGAQTWSYTRTDRTVCTAMQDNGITVAVYRLHGNCDELTAVDTGTGARSWTRTLDKDTAEFDGPATFAVDAGMFFFVSHTSVYMITDGGVNDWTFHHPGCRIGSAVFGSAGALIDQTCHGQDCNGARFCGDGRQLLLRDEMAGNDTDSKTNKNNPDQIIWNRIGSTDVPMLAGRTVAARTSDGTRLQLFGADRSRVLGKVSLRQRSTDAPVSTSTLDADLLWTGGTTYALRAGATSFAWRATTRSAPTVVTTPVVPVLDSSTPAVATTTGAALLDPSTGAVRTGYRLPAPPSGSRVYRFGSGFVVAGTSTAVYR